MRKIIACVIILSFSLYWAFAQDDLTLLGKEMVQSDNTVSGTENPQTNSVTVSAEPEAQEILKSNSSQEDSFTAMKSFLDQETAKEKEIRLLNLDLERINLQLKRQKLLSDIQGLSRGDQPTNLDTGNIDNEPLRDTRIIYLVYSDHLKEVILNINGGIHKLKENDRTAGVTVKNILEDGVIVQSQDGVETRIPFLGISGL